MTVLAFLHLNFSSLYTNLQNLSTLFLRNIISSFSWLIVRIMNYEFSIYELFSRPIRSRTVIEGTGILYSIH